MGSIKEIAQALFIILSGALIMFLCGLAWNKTTAWFKSIKESQKNIEAIKEKNTAHYDADTLSFQKIEKKLEDVMIQLQMERERVTRLEMTEKNLIESLCEVKESIAQHAETNALSLHAIDGKVTGMMQLLLSERKKS